MLQESVYHILLRTSALTLSLMLLFVSGIFSPVTQQLTSNAETYLATAIGMNAAVLPNEVNTLSAQLEQRNRELTQREIAVNLKEETGSTQSDMTTFLLSGVVFILLVLIVLNYVLDYMRLRNGSILIKNNNEQMA